MQVNPDPLPLIEDTPAVAFYIKGNSHTNMLTQLQAITSCSSLSTVVLCALEDMEVSLCHDFLLALHGAEQAVLHWHEALANEALGATRALEAVRLGVPVVLAVGNSLSLRLHRLLA